MWRDMHILPILNVIRSYSTSWLHGVMLVSGSSLLHIVPNLFLFTILFTVMDHFHKLREFFNHTYRLFGFSMHMLFTKKFFERCILLITLIMAFNPLGALLLILTITFQSSVSPEFLFLLFHFKNWQAGLIFNRHGRWRCSAVSVGKIRSLDSFDLFQ